MITFGPWFAREPSGRHAFETDGERGWGGSDPPIVVFQHSRSRSGETAKKIFSGFKPGALTVDGYAAYDVLADPRQTNQPWEISYCWTHWRRRFIEFSRTTASPICEEMIARIADLYRIEASIRGADPDTRLAARQDLSKPIALALCPWLEAQLDLLPSNSDLARHIRYGLKRWEELTRFLDDGRIEMDTNPVENATRKIALTRKNVLFAGSDDGAVTWARMIDEVEADRRMGEILWRETGDGHGTTLTATAAGLAAIGIEPDGGASAPTSADEAPIAEVPEDASAEADPAPKARTPRTGTKQAMLIEMLRAEGGATIDEIVAVTQWRPHTVGGQSPARSKSGLGLRSLPRRSRDGGELTVSHSWREADAKDPHHRRDHARPWRGGDLQDPPNRRPPDGWNLTGQIRRRGDGLLPADRRFGRQRIRHDLVRGSPALRRSTQLTAAPASPDRPRTAHYRLPSSGALSGAS